MKLYAIKRGVILIGLTDNEDVAKSVTNAIYNGSYECMELNKFSCLNDELLIRYKVVYEEGNSEWTVSADYYDNYSLINENTIVSWNIMTTYEDNDLHVYHDYTFCIFAKSEEDAKEKAKNLLEEKKDILALINNDPRKKS